jgi:hypothetical protein
MGGLVVDPLVHFFTRLRAVAHPRAARTAPGAVAGLSDLEARRLAQYAEGISGILGERGGAAIGSLLCGAPALDRTYLVSSLATGSEPQRLALARACSYAIQAVGLDTAMQYLERDPSRSVRSAIRRASAQRSVSTRARYEPEHSRQLAEAARISRGAAATRTEADRRFEQYHNPARMALLAEEVEALRRVVEQARRIQFSPECGYVEVRHVLEALKAADQTAAPTPRVGTDGRVEAP